MQQPPITLPPPPVPSYPHIPTTNRTCPPVGFGNRHYSGYGAESEGRWSDLATPTKSRYHGQTTETSPRTEQTPAEREEVPGTIFHLHVPDNAPSEHHHSRPIRPVYSPACHCVRRAGSTRRYRAPQGIKTLGGLATRPPTTPAPRKQAAEHSPARPPQRCKRRPIALTGIAPKHYRRDLLQERRTSIINSS